MALQRLRGSRQGSELAQILHRGSWYQPLSSKSILESDFEQSILRYSPHLFPGFRCVPFTTLVESDYGSSKADLALVDLHFRSWVVVEVELEHHSLSQHVEPQLRRLSLGRYGEQHAGDLADAAPDLSTERLRRLVLTVEPVFLVIVPHTPPEWQGTLANLGVKIAAVEVFVNDLNDRVLRVSGDKIRTLPEEYVSRLVPEPFLPRAMRIETPSALDARGILRILLDDQVTLWKVIEAQKASYLIPEGTLTLSQAPYILERAENNLYHLRKD